jgi:hypothetical protein
MHVHVQTRVVAPCARAWVLETAPIYHCPSGWWYFFGVFLGPFKRASSLTRVNPGQRPFERCLSCKRRPHSALGARSVLFKTTICLACRNLAREKKPLRCQ